MKLWDGAVVDVKATDAAVSQADEDVAVAQTQLAEIQVSWEADYVRVLLRNFASIPVADRFPWQLSLTVM